MLARTSKIQSGLFAALNQEIVNDLDYNYIYDATSFPSRPELETHTQSTRRMLMIEDWIGNHTWEATNNQKRRILTLLFYSIWNKRHALLSSSHQSLASRSMASLPSSYVQSDLVFTQSRDCKYEKYSAHYLSRPSIQP